jgi:peroxiredoxin
MRAKLLIVSVLVALSQISATVAVAEKKPPQWIPAAQRKKANLAAELKTPDGKAFSLESVQGKILVLNYWATWCQPCKEELPSIAELYKKVHDRGVEIVAVTPEKPDAVQKYLKDKNFPFTIVIDPKDTLGRRFDLGIVPATLVIDDSGKIALKYSTQFDWSSPAIVQGIESLIEKGGN